MINNPIFYLESSFSLIVFIIVEIILFYLTSLFHYRYFVKRDNKNLPITISQKLQLKYFNYLIVLSLVLQVLCGLIWVIYPKISQTQFIQIIPISVLFIYLINLFQVIYIQISLSIWVADTALLNKKRNWRTFFWLTIIFGLIIPIILAFLSDAKNPSNAKTKFFNSTKDFVAFIKSILSAFLVLGIWVLFILVPPLIKNQVLVFNQQSYLKQNEVERKQNFEQVKKLSEPYVDCLRDKYDGEDYLKTQHSNAFRALRKNEFDDSRLDEENLKVLNDLRIKCNLD